MSGGGTGGPSGPGTGGTMGTQGLSTSDFAFYFESYDPAQEAWVRMNPTQQQYFFNRARCECNGDATNFSGYVKLAIVPSTGTPQKIQTLLQDNLVSTGAGRLYAGMDGVDCLVPTAYVTGLSSICTNLLDPSDYTAGFPMTVFLSQRMYESPPIPVAWLYNSLAKPACGAGGTCDATSTCATTSTSQSIYFWAQTSASPYPDRSDLSVALTLVGRVPYTPTGVTATPGNEALVVNWGWPSSISPQADSSFLGVQLFCQREADAQVFAAGEFAQSYMTSASLCPNAVPSTSPNGPFGNLDPRYLCSGLLPPTTTSHRITGLQNGIPYGVGIVAVDKFGNVSELSTIAYATPDSSISAPRFGSQGSSCELTGRHGRPGPFSSLLGIGLIVALLRRRCWPGGGHYRREVYKKGAAVPMSGTVRGTRG
jgi:hypothetical protein